MTIQDTISLMNSIDYKDRFRAEFYQLQIRIEKLSIVRRFYMNDLVIFNNEEFGSVRTIVIDDEPWFIGKDVAVALGYKDTSDA